LHSYRICIQTTAFSTVFAFKLQTDFAVTGVFGFMQMTLLLNKFTLPWYSSTLELSGSNTKQKLFNTYVHALPTSKQKSFKRE